MTDTIRTAAIPVDAAIVARATAAQAPSFAELVHARFGWWHASENGGGNAADSYREVLRRFEDAHGTVVHAFWCSHVASGVALTEQKRPFPLRSTLTFHRESDWATKRNPELAAELHRCDELAIRARAVLTGVRQRICLHLVAASAAHLLSLADRSAASQSSADGEQVLKHEHRAIDRAWDYYEEAANGQSEIVYFAGMAAVAAAVSVAAGLFLTVEWRVGVAALVAGAVGAVVSVIQRINGGSFQVNHDVGRPYAFFLGGLRPLIGGAFAIAISFAFSSGILHLPVAASGTRDDRHLALIVVSFLAGFSERWAQDTLTAAMPQAAAQPEPMVAADPGTDPTT